MEDIVRRDLHVNIIMVIHMKLQYVNMYMPTISIPLG